mmetsp:Transcript_12299/g.28407  ORF Transcript_12299/g.28407 Transcript_12299/m.28407 type:complete len:238 (+) Transcript_12299:436-1149(+)
MDAGRAARGFAGGGRELVHLPLGVSSRASESLVELVPCLVKLRDLFGYLGFLPTHSINLRLDVIQQDGKLGVAIEGELREKLMLRGAQALLLLLMCFMMMCLILLEVRTMMRERMRKRCAEGKIGFALEDRRVFDEIRKRNGEDLIRPSVRDKLKLQLSVQPEQTEKLLVGLTVVFHTPPLHISLWYSKTIAHAFVQIDRLHGASEIHSIPGVVVQMRINLQLVLPHLWQTLFLVDL